MPSAEVEEDNEASANVGFVLGRRFVGRCRAVRPRDPAESLLQGSPPTDLQGNATAEQFGAERRRRKTAGIFMVDKHENAGMYQKP